MEIKDWNWLHDDKLPTVDGWYAVINCWDVQEGMFLGTDQFKDGKWISSGVSAFHGPFQTKEEAKEWAYDNDPEI